MFCPKCGKDVGEGIQTCPSCGLDFSTMSSKPNVVNDVQSQRYDTPVVPKQENGRNTIVMIAFLGLAVVVLIMFFMAASSIANGGSEIMQIQSVGGQTLDEAYYFELGGIYTGYAMISRALGIFFASVLVWLGIKK